MSRIFSLSSQHKRSGYDIPLHLKLGTEFLVILTALMAFLSLFAATGNLALGHLTHSWTSGLENTLTIEIPAPHGDEESLKKLLNGLRHVDGVTSAKVLDQKEMRDLLSPWLGNNNDGIWADLPIPTLITVRFSERTQKLMQDITDTTRKLAPDATVDAHEEWLVDLLKLVHRLQVTSYIILALILLVTSVVIAGAVRSRMAIHHRELELLHIMGASDRYIAGQFVSYILWQSIKGVVVGALLGAMTLGLFMFSARHNPGTVPEISITGTEWLVFLVVPLLIVGISLVAARITALRVLGEMP